MARNVTDRRRSAGRTRFAGALLLVLSLVSATVCLVVLAVWLPGDMARLADYRAAEPCPARAATTSRQDCVRTVEFTVEDITIHRHGRNHLYTATLSGTLHWDGVVRFGGADPLLERLEPGDRVTGTVWRGDVMTLARDGVRQSTSDEPRDEPQIAAGIGTMPGLLAVQAGVFGVARLTRPDDHEPLTWRPYGNALLAATGVAGFGVGWVFLVLGLPWPAVPVVVVAVVATVAWQLHRFLTRGRPGPGARRRVPATGRRDPATGRRGA